MLFEYRTSARVQTTLNSSVPGTKRVLNTERFTSDQRSVTIRYIGWTISINGVYTFGPQMIILKYEYFTSFYSQTSHTTRTGPLGRRRWFFSSYTRNKC